MIQSKSDLYFYIQEDFKANLGHISKIRYLVYKFIGLDCYFAYNYLENLRLLEYTLNCRKGLIRSILVAYYTWQDHRLQRKYNITIKPNTVGYGLRMPHIIGGGIIIRCKSMGNYCFVNTNVLIGTSGDSAENRPVIGDNVSFATGCKVYGAIKIGNNVDIAPNAAVCKDVPDNVVVGGVPAKVIKIKNV